MDDVLSSLRSIPRLLNFEDNNHKNKYQGLIKRSFFKKIRDMTFQFYDYCQSVSPSIRVSILIFSYLYYYQMYIVSFCPRNEFLWENKQLISKILNVIFCIGYIAPAKSSNSTMILYAMAIDAILFIYFAFLFVNVCYFHRKSKIPQICVGIISIFVNLFTPYMISVLSYQIGALSYMICIKDHFGVAVTILVFHSLFLVNLIFIIGTYISSCLLFRPRLIPILYSRPCVEYFICHICTEGLISFGTYVSTTLNSALIIYASIIPCSIVILITFKAEYWLTYQAAILHRLINIIDTIFIIVMGTLRILEYRGNEFLLVFAISAPNISALIIKQIVNKTKAKTLQKLNELEKDASSFSSFPLWEVRRCLKIGFENGHQLCHKWILFQLALQKFPKDRCIMVMFARYASIYASESNTLQFVAQHLKENKKHSIELKHLLFQISSLNQQRETGLSKNLKKSIDHISEKVEGCRSQIRYIWDCVIHGNLINIEEIFRKLKNTEDDIIRDYNQLCLIYPNNQYVASSYAAFLTDIAQDEKEGNMYAEMYKKLRQGSIVKMEKAYYFASLQYSSLPTEESHKMIINPPVSKIGPDGSTSYSLSFGSRNSISEVQQSIMNDFIEKNDEKSQKRSIEAMINMVKLPSMKYGPTLLLITLCVSILISFLSNLVSICKEIRSCHRSIYYITNVGTTMFYYANADFFLQQYVFSQTGITPELYTIWAKSYPYTNFGVNDNSNKKLLYYYLSQLQETFTNIMELFSQFYSKSSSFEQSLYYFFGSHYSERLFVKLENESISQENVNISFIDTISQFIRTTIISSENATNSTLLDPEYISIFANSVQLLTSGYKFYLSVENSLKEFLKISYKHTTLVQILSNVLIILIAIFSIMFLLKRIQREKKNLYGCFKVLPKGSVSAIIAELNAQSGKHNGDETGHIIQKNPQEENAYRIFTSTGRREALHHSEDFLIILLFIIWIIIGIVMIILYSLLVRGIYNSYHQAIPFFTELYQTHNSQVLLLILLERYALSTCSDTLYSSYIFEGTNFIQQEFKITNEFLIDSMRTFQNGNESRDYEGYDTISELKDILLDYPDAKICSQDFQISLVLKCISYHNGNNFILHIIKNQYYLLQNTYYSSGSTNFSTFDMEMYALISAWLFWDDQDHFLFPSFNAGLKYIDSKTNTLINNRLIPITIIFLIIMSMLGISITYVFTSTGNVTQWSLRLLLFCQPTVLNSSKKIMKILGNSFTNSGSNDQSELEDNQNLLLYEAITYQKKEPVFIFTPDLMVRSCNFSAFQLIPTSLLSHSFSLKSTRPVNEELCEQPLQTDYLDEENPLSNEKFETIVEDDDHSDLSQLSEKSETSSENDVSDSKVEEEISDKTSDEKKTNKDTSLKIPLDKLFTSPKRNGSLATFLEATERIVSGASAPYLEMDVEIVKDEEIAQMRFRVTGVGVNGVIQKKASSPEGLAFLVLSITDMTELTNQQRILQEEKKKSEDLLTSALPRQVVSRMIDGENEIIYNVTKTVVIIIDLGSFLIWSHKKPAFHVMNIFEKIVGVFDRIMQRYQLLTCVQSFPLIYSVVANYFDDCNPSLAAKQAVCFSLDCLSEGLELIVSDMVDVGKGFQFTIGVNYGGPLVGSVMGTEKPLFNLFGPIMPETICLARTGVPLHVHISKSIYELIYGNHFEIKAGTQMVFKDATMDTYLVSGYQQSKLII